MEKAPLLRSAWIQAVGLLLMDVVVLFSPEYWMMGILLGLVGILAACFFKLSLAFISSSPLLAYLLVLLVEQMQPEPPSHNLFGIELLFVAVMTIPQGAVAALVRGVFLRPRGQP